MAAAIVWSCIICGAKADVRPPRKCPKCGVPASRWRMVVDRSPAPSAAPPQEKSEPDQKDEGEPEALAS